ncbi:hypothetical protein MMC07_009160 [Pseudocyphellaria aurata]|nr:hypothetical protein [Pseudocyphellaria aurata]
MSATPPATPSAKPSATVRDLEILSMAFQCITSPLKIDFDKLANLGGFKTKASACASLSAVKKKLNLSTDGSTAGPSAPAGDTDETVEDSPVKSIPVKPTTKRVRKAKVNTDGEGNDIDATSKKNKQRELNADEENSIADGNDGGETSKPKKRGRKPAVGSTLSAKRVKTSPMTNDSAGVGVSGGPSAGKYTASTTFNDDDKFLSVIKHEEVDDVLRSN